MEYVPQVGPGTIMQLVMMIGGFVGAYAAFKTWQATINAQIGDQQKVNGQIVSEQKEISKILQSFAIDIAVLKEHGKVGK